MNMQASVLPVTREPFPEDHRLDIAERLFGVSFPLQLEPVVYGITDRMVGKYTGGYWYFYTLSNGVFCMAPAEDRCFHVKCQKRYQGDLSADAPGSRPACTPTATCRSRSATSPGSTPGITTC